MSEALVPVTGELLDLRALPTDEIIEKVYDLSEVSGEIRRFRAAAAEELAERLDHEGKRSVTIGEWHVEVTKPLERKWDVDRLADVLDKFVEAGVISQRKASACLRVKTEVNAREVDALLSNPKTAPEVSLCFEDEPAARQIKKVSRVD